MQRVEYRGHHGQRTQVGVVQHFVMKLFARRAPVNVQGDRNHVGLLAKLSQDAGVAVLHESADRFGGVYDLESIER